MKFENHHNEILNLQIINEKLEFENKELKNISEISNDKITNLNK